MNRATFFDHVRAKPFAGSLTQQQVDGMNMLLDVWGELYPDAPAAWVANSLAQIHHETATRMWPIKETVMPGHTRTNPSDAEVIRRLDRAFAAGKLRWVKKVYWKEGFFGRGHIQLTHESNYRAMGSRLGVDLVANPALALDPRISAKVAIIGMVEGRFTGRKLADYFDDDLSDPRGARRIVNGPDGTEAKIATIHGDFMAALKAAGYGKRPAPPLPPARPAPVPPAVNKDMAPVAKPAGGLALLFRILARIFGGKA